MAGFLETVSKAKQYDSLKSQLDAAKQSQYLDKAYQAGAVGAREEAEYYGRVNGYLNELKQGKPWEAIIGDTNRNVDGTALREALDLHKQQSEKYLNNNMATYGQANAPMDGGLAIRGR